MSEQRPHKRNNIKQATIEFLKRENKTWFVFFIMIVYSIIGTIIGYIFIR
ncbi:hypothetical protein SAMN05421733_10283 [Acinetobacter boissieri]|uniref:Uncharacterized protein n=1 Tax=Acinetobacter boissieri TaxID=1219383 RepID=A0A1G6GRN9_9GAMM|nr:hypothetical protein SAMN05421733_10283 [Acinetobacter boissieri]